MAVTHSSLIPSLPEGLEGLAELALDLRWSWSRATDPLWDHIDRERWAMTRNPWLILQSASAARLKALAEESDFRKQVQAQLDTLRQELDAPTWFAQAHGGTAQRGAAALTVAYFSMEFGLSEALPIYSGGLGVLAGDHLKTASDLGVPMTGVGLLYQQGYFRQAIDPEGNQIELYPNNDPSQLPVLPVRNGEGEWLRIDVDFPGRVVRLRVWEVKVGRVKLYLLDSDDPVNGPADRCITSELYGGEPQQRLQQEIVLGVGGWRLLRALSVRPDVCHLNEGHAALATLERARTFMEENSCAFDVALTATRAGNVFTTHTAVPAGFNVFPPALVGEYLGSCADRLGIGLDGLLALGRAEPKNAGEPLNMAYLAVHTSGRVNGVSQLHGEVSRRIFQPLFPQWPNREVPVVHVANGVHVPSWQSIAADELWSKSCGSARWLGTMSTVQADCKLLSDEALWAFRQNAAQQLIAHVRDRFVRQVKSSGSSEQAIAEAGAVLDPNALTLGFARRFATYKRPNLLLHDAERLARLLQNAERPVQIILAGKAHPKDGPGKELIRAWCAFARRPEIRARTIFLADYDMSLAERLVQGIDLWINTPRRPWEASGTSGMKVLVNGGLNLSELDGWWAEAFNPQVGWAIGDGQERNDDPAWDAQEAEQLYHLLESEVVPAFFERDERGIPKAWVARMRASMSELTPRFSSNRMLREYVDLLYMPAAQAWRDRSADGARKAAALCEWRKAVESRWGKILLGKVSVGEKEAEYLFNVPVALDDLDPSAVQVQIFADSAPGKEPEIHRMDREQETPDLPKGYAYSLHLAKTRPAADYKVRVIPASEGALIPIEANAILWSA